MLCLIESTQVLSADPLPGTSGTVSHTINSSPVRRPATRDLWCYVSYNQLKPCPQTPYQGPLALCLIQSTQALSADPLPGTSGTVSHTINLSPVRSPLLGTSGTVSHTINSSPVRRPLIRDLWHYVSYNQLKPCPQTPYQGPLALCLIQSTQALSADPLPGTSGTVSHTINSSPLHRLPKLSANPYKGSLVLYICYIHVKQ